MPKIVVHIIQDDVGDPDDVPTYEDGVRCFYWGAFADSPIPNIRTWVLFDGDTTREEAHKVVTETFDLDAFAEMFDCD